MAILDISELALEMGLEDTITDRERAILNTAISRAESSVYRHLRYDPFQRTRTEYYPQQEVNHPMEGGHWDVSGSSASIRYPSGSMSLLQLRHIPVRSITSLHIDFDGRSGAKSGAFAASTEKTEGEDFWPNYDADDDDGNKLCHDGLLHSIGAWPTNTGSVKIVYVAGYTIKELHGQKALINAQPILDAIISEAVGRAKRAFVHAKTSGLGFTAGTVTEEKLGNDYSYKTSNSIDSVGQTTYGTSTLSSEAKDLLRDYVNWGVSITSP